MVFNIIFWRESPFSLVNLLVAFESELEAKWFANEWVAEHEGFIIQTVSPYYEHQHDDPVLLN